MNRSAMALVFFLLVNSFSLWPKPFQFTKSESTLVNRVNSLEIKNDLIYKTGYIPTALLLTKLRYGVFSQMEVSLATQASHFIDQKESRLSSIEGLLKAELRKTRLANFNLAAYCKFLYKLGDPLIAEVDDLSDDIVRVVSEEADGGRDVSFALLARKGFHFWAARFYLLTLGFTYTRTSRRDFGDFTDSDRNVFGVLFTPQSHIVSSLMIAIENELVYWPQRGYQYKILPQLRWEFQSYWVLEMGVQIPVAASNNYEFIFGLSMGKG